MPGPKAPTIELDDAQRAALEQLVRAHSTAQTLVTRACCILLASEGMTTTEIGRQLGLEADTVRVWRARWRACAHIPLAECSVAARLADAPRAGAPARITPEHICQIVALSCETPAESDQPVERPRIGERDCQTWHCGPYLPAPRREAVEKNWTCSPTGSVTGSTRRPASPKPYGQPRPRTCVRCTVPPRRALPAASAP